MGNTLATMFTVSTYGTWLGGDARCWVYDGIIFAEQPSLQAYDKCWCFDWRSVESRIDYVECHNLRNGWPRAPWEFVTRPPEQQ